jgi:membrane-bound ClpP family serine protease
MDIFFLSVIGFSGLALLLLLVALDGIIDIFGGEPVLPAGAMFVTVFGLMGALILSLNNQDGLSVAWTIGSVVAAVLSCGGFYTVFRTLHKKAAEDEAFVPNLEDLVGRSASVDWWIGDKGSVFVSWLGQQRSFQASADTPLTSGDVVTVARVVNDRSVVVTKN